MTANNGAGAGTVDIDVTGDDFRLDAIDVGWTAGEESGGECKFSRVGRGDRFIEVAHFDYAENGAENFFLGDAKIWPDICENCRRYEESFFWHIRSLISERRLLFSDLDV
jgi:hypothetical protein